MAARHRNPDCTGEWLFQYNGTMHVTFITCSKCGAGTSDETAAKKENETGLVMNALASEGRKILTKERDDCG